MPRSRRAGKIRSQNWGKYRTVLMFQWDYFSEIDHEPTMTELRQAWRELGPSILADFEANPKQRAGTRPYAWWIFEQGFDHRPSHEEQLEYLQSNGLLTETERRVLVARQRREESTI